MSADNYSGDKPVIMAHLVAGYPDAAGAMAAAQALDMRRPDKISPAARRAFDVVRSAVPMLDDDRPQVDDIAAIAVLVGSGAFATKD